MHHYYMRIEAVNFDYSVYDTHDISTIRGGSFLILNALKNIPNVEFPEMFGVDVITAEASEAILRFKSEPDQVKSVHDRILSAIPQDTLEFATFVSAFMPICDDISFVNHVESLKASCRRQQYAKLSFVPPRMPRTDRGACDLDGVRPAIRMEGDTALSEMVFKRRRKGRVLRNRLYNDILEYTALRSDELPEPSEISESKFVDDLETLSSHPEMGRLDGKIAFIHIDGNSFGKIRQKGCRNEEELKRFQELVQKKIRNVALRSILTFAMDSQNPSFRTAKGDIRLETLLWGGDEIEWVVPAWQAFNVLKLFYQATANQYYRMGENDDEKSLALTHAAGVVFCRHNLPILQIRKYAGKLCDYAKRGIPSDVESITCAADRFAFLNMASLDLIKGDVDSFIETYHLPASADQFVLQASELESLEKNIRVLKRLFPKTKLFDISDALNRRSLNEIDDIIERSIDLSRGRATELRNAIDAITGGNPYRWYVIADLFNYIGEDR